MICLLLSLERIASDPGTGGGGGGGGNTTPIDITLAEAISMNMANSWVLGQIYKIVDPPLPLAAYTAIALESLALGEVRLSTSGIADVHNYDSSIYNNQVVCGWDFSDFNNLDSLYLFDPLNNIEVWQSGYLSSNAASCIQWDGGTCYNVKLTDVFVTGFSGGLNINDSILFNSVLQYNSHTDCVIADTTSNGGTIQLKAPALYLAQNNIYQGATLRAYSGLYGITLNQFSFFRDSTETTLPDLAMITVGKGSSFDLMGFACNNSSIGENIYFELLKAQNDRYCDGNNSTFEFRGDLDDPAVYDSGTQSLFYPDFHGVYVLNNNTGADVTIVGMTFPSTVFFPVITFVYGQSSMNEIFFTGGGNFSFSSLLPHDQSLNILPEQLTMQAAKYSALWLLVPDKTHIL